MKVLLIGPLPQPMNGCSYANETLLRNLKSRGIACVAIDTNTKTISAKQGNRFSFKKAFSFFRSYLQIYKVFPSSVVYITPGQTFFGVGKYAPFILLCRVLGKPYVIHLHGNYLGEAYADLQGAKKIIFQFFVSGAAAGIALSPSLRKNFKNLLPDNKVYVAENFVDSVILSEIGQKQAQQMRILYLSNLMEEKGILDLLDALISIDNRDFDFRLTIAGALEEGIEPKFSQRCQVLGNRVNYVGPVTGDKKCEVLQSANVFVLPTYYKMEGQPICLLEGMAAGNIIVTTAHAGIPDVISETNGFFVPSRSPETLSICLQNIHRNLSGLLEKYSEHNRTYAAATFTEKKFTDNVLKVLYECAKA